jgi:hypothetical protein
MGPNQSVNGENEAPDGHPDQGIDERLGGENAAVDRPNPHIRRSIHGSAPGEIERILATQAPAPARLAPTAPQDLGPCLYFGPAGERCDRRAVQDGFCSKHQPGAKPLVSSSKPTKVMAAAIAIIGILLPYLIDLLRELARLFPR